MKVTRGSRVTFPIIHRRAEATQSHMIPCLESYPIRSRSGPRGRGCHLGQGRHLGFSQAPPCSPINRTSPDSSGTVKSKVLGNGEMSACLLPSLSVYGKPPKCW